MKYVVFGLLAALLILIIILVINTLRFKPIEKEFEKVEIEKVDVDHLVESMQNLIRFKTISNIDDEKVDANEFEGFREYLRNRYPVVFSNEVQYLGPSGILVKIEGQEVGEPSVLMSHYDVVEVSENWEHDPFGGELIDGVIWGRGAIDNKATLCGILESLEDLLKKGFKPKHASPLLM